MIDVNEAERIILEQTGELRIEEIELDQCPGRVLAEPIAADRDFPPFDRVAMDGIAIRYTDFQTGKRSFNISGIQPAGSPPLELTSNNALEVMTGAVLPQLADTVIRYEDISTVDGIATINIDKVTQYQNVHRQGTDRKKGDILLEESTYIRPTEIGVLATVGKTSVKVYALPKIAVISTGDELVEVEDNPLPHQIRKSNIHSLKSLLLKHKIVPDLVHLQDNPKNIRTTVSTLLDRYDVLLLSGAVSRGKFDFLPEILEELGVNKLFHRVAQRPGKPFWFGTKGNCRVFAFPGNPVSTFLCAVRFFEPWLKKSLHQAPNPQKAILAENITFTPNLTYFLQVKTRIEDGKFMAQPVPGHGSGDLANLSITNGFLQLPPDRSEFSRGEVFPLWAF